MIPSTVLWRILCLFLAASQASPVPYYGHRVVEQLPGIPEGWSEDRPPSPSTSMKFRMAIRHDKTAEIEQKAVDISTPGNRLYGQFMKREEIDDLLRPSDNALNAILSWMKSEHVPNDKIERHGNWLTWTIPVSQAEKMLHTRFRAFRNDDSQNVDIRTLEYSVPRHVYDHIQMIQPTTRFGDSNPQEPPWSNYSPDPHSLDDSCSSVVTPGCLRALYGVYDTQAHPNPQNTLGMSGFLDQYARYDDFYSFMRAYSPHENEANFTVVSINGGLNEQNSFLPSHKASIDVQYALSLAYNTTATYYTTGGHDPSVSGAVDAPKHGNPANEPYLEQLHYLLGLPDKDLPAVLSTSYSTPEHKVPVSYANQTCNMFAQLGARGVSVIFASGDSEVRGPCSSHNDINNKEPLPSFPASCPFVTAVGGTHDVNPEKAASFSGGGFSEVFPRPEYQDNAVRQYFDKLDNEQNRLYKQRGRGVPDVAAQAVDFLYVDHGRHRKSNSTRFVLPILTLSWPASLITHQCRCVCICSHRLPIKRSSFGERSAQNGVSEPLAVLAEPDGFHGYCGRRLHRLH